MVELAAEVCAVHSLRSLHDAGYSTSVQRILQIWCQFMSLLPIMGHELPTQTGTPARTGTLDQMLLPGFDRVRVKTSMSAV